jgi:hypothetical protein
MTFFNTKSFPSYVYRPKQLQGVCLFGASRPSLYDKRKKRNVKGFAEFLWLSFAGGINREARRAEKPSESAVKKQR